MSVTTASPSAGGNTSPTSAKSGGSSKAASIIVSRRKSSRLRNKTPKAVKVHGSNDGPFPFILVTEGPRSQEDNRKVRSHAMHYHIARTRSLDSAQALKGAKKDTHINNAEEAHPNFVASEPSSARSQPNPKPSDSAWTYPFLSASSGPLSVLTSQFSSQSHSEPLPMRVPIEMQARFNRYLHHFATINHEASGDISGFFRCWGALIARDAILFHAIIGLCANQISCMMYGVDSSGVPDPNISAESRDALACKSKAMRMIRSSIDRQQLNTDSAIAAIAFLALSEAISLANHTIASMHVSAIVEFIALRGGMETLPLHALRGAIAADLKTASLKLSAPTIRYDFGVTTHNLIRSMTSENHGTMASAFSSHLDILSMPTLAIIEDLRDFAIFKWNTPDTVGNDALVSAGNHEKCAIEHRLLTYTALRGADGSIDRCIHVTFLLFLNTVAWLSFPALSRISHVLARHLRDALGQCHHIFVSQEMVALELWMKVVGVTVVQAGEDRDWFLAGIGRCIKNLEIQNFGVLMDGLKSHLIVEKVYGPSVSRIYEKIAKKELAQQD